MREPDSKTEALFTYVTPESFVPKDHPLRAFRKMADTALEGMDPLFDSIYATTGRSSIPPEKLLKAQLLMILYSTRLLYRRKASYPGKLRPLLLLSWH